MWARLRLDLTHADFAAAALACLRGGRARTLAARCEAAFQPAGGAFATYCVRSAFDLLLESLELPPGSEVLVSALTIPDMLRVIEAHGCVPVPLDLDLETLAPRPESVDRAWSPRTRLVLLAHLAGARSDLGGLVERARSHGLPWLEDAAQAFDGDAWRGSPSALATFFSFGLIKARTALGGALTLVREPDLLERMRALQARWSAPPRSLYARRLLKAGLLQSLSRPLFFGLLPAWARLRGRSLDELLHGAVRAFPGPDPLASLRHAPPGPLLRMLLRRGEARGSGRSARRARGEQLAGLLGQAVELPGRKAREHVHWIFPVLVPEPQALVEALRAHGFDATRRSSLVVVPPPLSRECEPASEARRFLDQVVYLPLHEEMPQHELERLARLVLDHSIRSGGSAAARPASARAPTR